MDAETRKLKMAILRMSEDESFKQIMKDVLQHDEKYKENVEKIRKLMYEGATFKEAFLKLSELKEEPNSKDLEELIEAVIRTQAVMPDEKFKEKIFGLWMKELRNGK